MFGRIPSWRHFKRGLVTLVLIGINTNGIPTFGQFNRIVAIGSGLALSNDLARCRMFHKHFGPLYVRTSFSIEGILVHNINDQITCFFRHWSDAKANSHTITFFTVDTYLPCYRNIHLHVICGQNAQSKSYRIALIK